MNKSKIEWTEFSWNPITGCLHDCPYCYAERISKRFSGDVRLNLMDKRCQRYGDNMYILDEPFVTRNGRSISYPFGFAPTLHKYRMDWPQQLKSGKTIFVGSMSDAFGEWVPDEWIEMIFNACGKSPQHKYMFLTKNPSRYNSLAAQNKLPVEYWYGYSYTGVEAPPEQIISNWRTFVSLEPLLSSVDTEFIRYDNTMWVIIGAESGSRKGKVIPKQEWIKEIVDECKKYNVPVFMKDSLIPIVGVENMRREFPPEMNETILSDKLQKKLYSHCGNCKVEKKKSEMIAILAREKRGDGPKAVGYICNDCFPGFEKGFEL